MLDHQALKHERGHNHLCCFTALAFCFYWFYGTLFFLPFASLQQQANFPTGINKLSCYLDVKYKQASVRK